MHPSDSDMSRGSANDPMNPVENEEKFEEMRIKVTDLVFLHCNGEMSLNEAESIKCKIIELIQNTW